MASKRESTDKQIAALARQAKSVAKFEHAYRVVRACADLLKVVDERVQTKALRAIGLSVLQRLSKSVAHEIDAQAANREVLKAIGTVIPIFSRTLFQKPPRMRSEKPAIERPVPRVKGDPALDQAALKKIAAGCKRGDIETPEALRHYANFVKKATELKVRRDAWRKGKAELVDAERESRNNNFLGPYYAKRLQKYETLFFGPEPTAG